MVKNELATFFILENLKMLMQQLQIVCSVGVCQCWLYCKQCMCQVFGGVWKCGT